MAYCHPLPHLWDVRFQTPLWFSGVPLKMLALIAGRAGGFRRSEGAREFGSGPLASSLLQSKCRS